jgi:hypothetical protein
LPVGIIIGKPPSPLRLVAAITAVASWNATLVEGMENRWDIETSLAMFLTNMMLVLIAAGV